MSCVRLTHALFCALIAGACTEPVVLGTAPEPPKPPPMLDSGEAPAGMKYFVTIAWLRSLSEAELAEVLAGPAWAKNTDCPQQERIERYRMFGSFYFDLVATVDSLPAAIVLSADTKPSRDPISPDGVPRSNNGPLIVFADGDGDGEFDQPFPGFYDDYPVADSIADDVWVYWYEEEGIKLIKHRLKDQRSSADVYLPRDTPIYFYPQEEYATKSWTEHVYNCAAWEGDVQILAELPDHHDTLSCEALTPTIVRWTEHTYTDRPCEVLVRSGLFCNVDPNDRLDVCW
jgi:hypothetical protein